MVLFQRLRAGSSRNQRASVIEDPPAQEQPQSPTQTTLKPINYLGLPSRPSEKDDASQGGLSDETEVPTRESPFQTGSSPKGPLSPSSEDRDVPSDDPPPYSEEVISSDPLAWTPQPRKTSPPKIDSSPFHPRPQPTSSTYLTDAHKSYIQSLLSSDILPELYDAILTRTPTITLLLLHPSLIPKAIFKPITVPSDTLNWIPGPTPQTKSSTHAIHGPLPNGAFVVEAGPLSENLHNLRLTDPWPDTQTLTQEPFYLHLGRLLRDRLTQAKWRTNLSYLQSVGGWSFNEGYLPCPGDDDDDDHDDEHHDPVAARLTYGDFWPVPKERNARVVIGPRRVTIRYENDFGLLDNETGIGLKIRVDFGFGDVGRAAI